MKEICAIVLAAGKSKRMKTDIPKILHPIMGKPIIDYVLDNLKSASIEKVILVVGHKKDMVMEYLGDRVLYAHQDEQKGTGHAVLQALPLLEEFRGDIMVLCGDMPLLGGDTLQEFVESHRSKGAKVSLMTAVAEEPKSLGRILRDDKGNVKAVVEVADASEDVLSIKEVNTGTYIFDVDYFREVLPHIGRPNAQDEIYLTDVVAISYERGNPVNAFVCPYFYQSMGINDRVDLADVSSVIRRRINEDIMRSGVTLYDPASTYIEAEVEIGRDTVIMPNTYLLGNTKIGKGCVIGPNVEIRNTVVGDGTKISFSVVTDSEIGNNVSVGPFSHIRPNTKIGNNVKIGNFVETKKSIIGDNTKASHLSYIGDATVGKNVNIGAGTITCNYDGKKKNPTVIKDGAFIGSNSSLVAPLVIGEGSATGAGSVVTKDVPDHYLAVGAPARCIKRLK